MNRSSLLNFMSVFMYVCVTKHYNGIQICKLKNDIYVRKIVKLLKNKNNILF